MRTYSIIFCILLALFLPQAVIANNYVIINQVMYDTPLNEKTNVSPACNGEFIELYNAGTEPVSLDGWKITGDGNTEQVTFSNNILPVEGFLVVACRRGANNDFHLDDLYTLPAGANYSIVYQNKIMLTNDGETITLINAQNDTIDQMHYDGNVQLGNPYLLHAQNNETTPGDSCVSLCRTYVEFDAEGRAIPNISQWQTKKVSIAQLYIPYPSYHENFITGDQTLPIGDNYMLSITPLDPTTRIDINNGQPSVSSGVRTRATLQYMDGIGRQDETIILGGAVNKKDLVSVNDFYGESDVTRQWLPIVLETEGQRQNISDIQSQTRTDYEDNRPFLEVRYENSARKRPLEQTRPGATYANYHSSLVYQLNDATDQVRIYTVNEDSSLHAGGNYGSATLYKNSRTDEDGKTFTTFTDKHGRKIMEKRDISRTYYVYDNLGRLRFILPNLPLSKLNDGDYALDNATLKAIAYCYIYDNCGNVIYKRLPGSEPQYMVYDQLGQLVLKQDGNQRLEGKWTMCAYDSLGRNVYTAEKTLPNNHSYYLNLFASRWQVEHYGSNQQNAILSTGYASTILGNEDLHLLTLNYYDNYEYLSALGGEQQIKLSFVQETDYGRPWDNSTGLLTGTRVYNLSEEGFRATAYYYDGNGRVVQSRSLRDSEDSTTIINTSYMFDGSIAMQMTVHGPDSNRVCERYRYTYDHIGHATQVHYRLNNESEIILSEFSYDSIGHLVQNLLYNKKDTIQYSYDIRNMLTEVHNKHFSERLFYADNLPLSVSPCRNGNISAMLITLADSTYTYGYTYDAFNRLTASNKLTNFGSAYSELYTYDDAGNILTLKRYNNNQLIDDLSYSYGNEGNRLVSIEDAGQNQDQYEIIEYHGTTPAADVTMQHDANGNMVSDIDRQISVIHYNLLNLPDTIQFTNGNQIVNLYDATGKKYKSITYTVLETAINPQSEIAHYTFETADVAYSVTEYMENIEYRYSSSDTTRGIFNTIGYYADSTYFHYIKDHLGNICAVIHSTADTIVQGTFYYASGVPMAQSFGRDKQPYLYNGKAFVEAHGWNTYDYGFRGYYATIGRFSTIDPLAEQTPWQSPYSYAGNRFINAIDWMGLGGMTGFSHNHDVLHYIVIDSHGNYLGGEDNDDNSIYIAQNDQWTQENGTDGLTRVGRMTFPFWMYEFLGKGSKAPGCYYGQISISISISFGFQAYLPTPKGDIGVSLPSWEVLNITYTYDEGDDVTINYIGKNSRANISIGLNFGGFQYEYALSYNVNSGYPIPNTWTNKLSYQSVNISPDILLTGIINYTYSLGIGIVGNISITGNIYYETDSDS